MRSTVLWFVASLALGQTDDAPWRRMLDSKRLIQEQLTAAARRITDRAAEEIASPERWEAVRARRVEEMRDMLGLLPWPERTPLNVRIAGALDKGTYTVEKIAFESKPKLYVTGNLYLPKQRAGRVPAIVYVCGHAHSPHGDKTQYQRHGISFAKNGYACFILDSIQIAETWAAHHGVGWQEMPDWYARGYTPAGVEVWNAMRAIDYLETRPEIDAARIGMTGRSGGAAMTWFTAAVDPRVKAAVPVMGISTYAANVRLDTQKRHCDCMFPINTYGHDMIHQGALIAPRPLLMAHGRLDELFPEEGYTEFERKVGGLYRGYGKPGLFGNVVVETGHQDSDLLRERAIRWFDTHLMGVSERKLDMDYSNAEPQSLAVFGGGTGPADAVNYRVHETFTTRPPAGPVTSVAAFRGRREEVLRQLRRRVFAMGFDGAPVRTVLKTHGRPSAKAPALVYIASDGEDGTAIEQMFIGLGRALEPVVRLIVYPRGADVVPWERSFQKATLRNAMHTGHTIDSLRLGDVLEAVKQLRANPAVDPARITVMGRGVAAGLAIYAALLDESVQQVLLLDPPESHAQGPIFLNAMRYTDLPEAAALLAPRPLNFYLRMPKAYEYARHVYALHGKPEHVFVSMHVEGVVDGRRHHGFSSGL